MKRVSVFMDVEDPIDPLSDDAALDFPRLFSDLGLRGSFCLTGEKCRVLTARGRMDVRDAFEPHCLGLHTNTHSYHPTTMELLADLTFEQGCEAAYTAEQPGFDAFAQLFGRRPAFWGGAGNTWSPEITDAMKRLSIPAYVYALTSLPHEAVHQFNGVTAVPQALSIPDADWADDQKAALASSRVLDAIEKIPQPWIGLFVGHPSRLRHKGFWDEPYFGGRTPEAPEYSPPASEEDYRRSKLNMRGFLIELGRRASVIGVDDGLAMPWSLRPPSQQELMYFRTRTAEQLRAAANWPVHRPGLDATRIVSKTLDLAETLQVASIP